MIYMVAVPVVLLAIWGLVDLIRRMERHFLNGRIRQCNIVILPLQGHIDDLEYIVRSAVSQNSWEECEGGADIVLLDNGLDEETRAVCEAMSLNAPVVFCDPVTLDEVLSKRIQFAK